MNTDAIAPAVIAFAVGLWLGWLRGSAERRSLEEWVGATRKVLLQRRNLLAAWIAVGAELGVYAQRGEAPARALERLQQLSDKTREAICFHPSIPNFPPAGKHEVGQ